ncbi:MAG: MauE/DoxX family redox-associated membrane protein [Verrucomicrobiota bacterium]
MDQGSCKIEQVTILHVSDRFLAWIGLKPILSIWMTRWIPAPVMAYLRFTLGNLFVWAGVLKVKDPQGFHESVLAFELIVNPLAAWVAILLPWLEIVLGLALIFKLVYRAAALCLGGLNLAFIVALSLAWGQGKTLDCGCFGSQGPTNLPLQIALDTLFLLVCALLFLDERPRSSSLTPSSARGLGGVLSS